MRALAQLARAAAGRRVGAVPAGARDPAGLHRRARRRRPRRDARRRSRAPAATPSGVDPLVPADLVIDHSRAGRRLRHALRVRPQHRARVRAQHRALRAAALGAGAPSTASASCRRAWASSTRSTSSTSAASCSCGRTRDGAVAVPDTLVGTDSHTTMIDALGMLGWGVGGIEAEAVLLGEPLVLGTPDGRRRASSAARLRTGVDGHRPRADADRDAAPRTASSASSSSSAATASPRCRCPTARRSPTWRPSTARPPRRFPVDDETLRYLDATGRGDVTAAGRGVHPRAGPVPRATATRSPTSASCWSSTSTPSSRAWPARGARRTACRSAGAPASFHEAYPREPNPARLRGATWCPRAASRRPRCWRPTSRSTTAPS